MAGVIGSLIPIAFFAMIAAIVIVPQMLKSRERARLHETLRAAYEKGQPVPPELIEALQTDRSFTPTPTPIDRAQRDLRVGIVWLFVGLGFVAIGVICYIALYNVGGSSESLAWFGGLGAIPGCIGLAFLLLSFFGRKKS